MYFISIFSQLSFIFHSFLLLVLFFFNFIVIGCRLQFSVKYTPLSLDWFEDICVGDAYSVFHHKWLLNINKRVNHVWRIRYKRSFARYRVGYRICKKLFCAWDHLIFPVCLQVRRTTRCSWFCAIRIAFVNYFPPYF